MSRTKLIIGGVVVLVVLAAIGSAASGSKNTPAGVVPSSTPGTSSVGQAANPSLAPSAAASLTPSGLPSGGYKVGDRVKLGDEEYFAVSQVDLTYKGTAILKPAAGTKWISALVEIEGINPSGASYNPFFFKLRDEQGFEYNFNAFGKDPQLHSSNDLKPGTKVKGWMTFEVPAGAKTYTLVYAPGFFNEPVEVALN